MMLYGVSGLTYDEDGNLGSAGAGKDVVAQALEGQGYCQVALADPIKRIAYDVFGFSRKDLWGPSENRSKINPKNGLAARQVLTAIGDAGRSLYENVWVDKAIEAYTKISSGGYRYSPQKGLIKLPSAMASIYSGVVISDMRYINEFEAVKNAGGKLIRVVRKRDSLVGDAAKHSSENGLSHLPDERFNYVLQNNGTKSALVDAVLELLD